MRNRIQVKRVICLALIIALLQPFSLGGEVKAANYPGAKPYGFEVDSNDFVDLGWAKNVVHPYNQIAVLHGIYTDVEEGIDPDRLDRLLETLLIFNFVDGVIRHYHLSARWKSL